MTLQERVALMRGDESLTAFARRAGISRQTLYKAFRRERETGRHGIDQATAEGLARAGDRSVAWIFGSEAEEQLVAPKDWYDEAMTLLVRKGVHASEARGILDTLLANSSEALRRKLADELKDEGQLKRAIHARVRRHEP